MNRPLPESRRTVLVFIMVISFRFDRPDGRIAAKRRKIVARGEGLVEDEHEPLVKKGVEGALTGRKKTQGENLSPPWGLLLMLFPTRGSLRFTPGYSLAAPSELFNSSIVIRKS
jgi:hypothetical protein